MWLVIALSCQSKYLERVMSIDPELKPWLWWLLVWYGALAGWSLPVHDKKSLEIEH